MKHEFTQQVNKSALLFLLENSIEYPLNRVIVLDKEIRDNQALLTYYRAFYDSLDEYGRVTVKYSARGNTKRLYGEQIGITNICRRIRHSIAKEYNIDLDMVNCHPTFLAHYCSQNSIEFPSLQYYIKNRSEILELGPKGEVKCQIISIINGGLPTSNLPFIIEFYNECQAVMEHTREIEPTLVKKLQKIKKENIGGRALNWILIEMESKVLEAMIGHLKKSKVSITSLAFDGLTIENSAANRRNIEVILRGCEVAAFNSIGAEIKMIEKPMAEGYDLPSFSLAVSEAKDPISLLTKRRKKNEKKCECQFDHYEMFNLLKNLGNEMNVSDFTDSFYDLSIFVKNYSAPKCFSLFIDFISKPFDNYDSVQISQYCIKCLECEEGGEEFIWKWALDKLPPRKKEFNSSRNFILAQIKAGEKPHQMDAIVAGEFLPENDIFEFVDLYRKKVFPSVDELHDDFMNSVDKYVKRIMFPACFAVNKGDGNIDIETQIVGSTRYEEFGKDAVVILSTNLFSGIGNLISRTDIQAIIPMYKNITFQPSLKDVKKGEYNMYQGFQARQVEAPDAKIIQPILSHILQCWANDDEDLYDYILQWFRQIFLYPSEKTQVVLILYGEEGAGKGILIDNLIIPYIFGSKISIATQGLDPITQRFNSVCMNKLFICCNEVSNGENNFHATFEKLKALITDKTMTIEKKGIDIFNEYPNFINFLFTTNNRDSVKLGRTDRRYACFETSKRFLKNYDYFDQLRASCSQECADHFFTYICQLPRTRNIKHIPSTQLKEDMLVMTLKSIDRFVAEINETMAEPTSSRDGRDCTRWDGVLFCALVEDKARIFIAARDFYECYKLWCKENMEKNVKSSTLFGREIKNFYQQRKCSTVQYMLSTGGLEN